MSIPVSMQTVESQPKSAGRDGERRKVKVLLSSCVILAVFVMAVITMALEDGAGGAGLTALVCVVVAAIAVGLWGTALAVRETEELGSRPED